MSDTISLMLILRMCEVDLHVFKLMFHAMQCNYVFTSSGILSLIYTVTHWCHLPLYILVMILHVIHPAST